MNSVEDPTGPTPIRKRQPPISEPTAHAIELEEVKVVLVISHTPWKLERVQSLARLRLELGEMPEWVCDWHLETTRAPNRIWARLQWDRAVELAAFHGASHVVFMQDDLEPAPAFWRRLKVILAGRPADMVSFHNGQPTAARTCFAKLQPGYTTVDALVGQLYAMPTMMLVDALSWLDNETTARIANISEDSTLGLFAMTRGHRIFHPVPTIYDHDLEIDSTFNNEEHAYRKPQVTWKEIERLQPNDQAIMYVTNAAFDVSWFAQPVPHAGRFYAMLHHHLPAVLKDKAKGERLFLEYEKDRPTDAMLRYFTWNQRG